MLSFKHRRANKNSALYSVTLGGERGRVMISSPTVCLRLPHPVFPHRSAFAVLFTLTLFCALSAPATPHDAASLSPHTPPHATHYLHTTCTTHTVFAAARCLPRLMSRHMVLLAPPFLWRVFTITCRAAHSCKRRITRLHSRFHHGGCLTACRRRKRLRWDRRVRSRNASSILPPLPSPLFATIIPQRAAMTVGGNGET